MSFFSELHYAVFSSKSSQFSAFLLLGATYHCNLRQRKEKRFKFSMFIQCQGRTSKNQDSFLLVHFKTNSRTTPPRENDIGSDTLITNVIFILYQVSGQFCNFMVSRTRNHYTNNLLGSPLRTYTCRVWRASSRVRVSKKKTHTHIHLN